MCQSSASPTPEAVSHACGTHRPEVGRLVPAAHDLDLPEVQFPSARVLATVGETGLRELVFHHHGRLRHSEIGHMFDVPDAQFEKLCGLIADFVVETCGGPRNYTATRGGGCIRTRHFPFSVDERSREVWIEHLFIAMHETGFPAELREEWWTWLEAMSVRMINRRTMKAQPVRITWAEAQARYGAALAA